MRLPLPTFLLAIYPKAFTQYQNWDSFDLTQWSANVYEYDRDAWRGMFDTIQPVEETLARGHGDCEDYALVAASYCAAMGEEPALGFCWRSGDWLPSHVITISDGAIYSSGEVHEETTVEEYVEQTQFVRVWTRRAV